MKKYLFILITLSSMLYSMREGLPSYEKATEPRPPLMPKNFISTSAKLADQRAYIWLYRGILNNSEVEIKEAFRGLKEYYLSIPTFPKDQIKEIINRPNCKGKAPLEWAVSLSRPRAVKALLECGACPAGLLHALQLGDGKSALTLLQYGACIPDNKAGEYMGYAIAMYNQDPETYHVIIQEMFNRGYKWTSHVNQHENPWALAIEAPSYFESDLELSESLADLFVQNGVNINKSIREARRTITPLGLAVERGDVNTVKLLLERGADATENSSENLLKKAAKHPDIAQLLRKYGAQT